MAKCRCPDCRSKMTKYGKGEGFYTLHPQTWWMGNAYFCEFRENCEQYKGEKVPCVSRHKKTRFACSQYHYKKAGIL